MLAVGDPYRVLQVDPEAEWEVIRAAYPAFALKYHPDVSSGSAAVRPGPFHALPATLAAAPGQSLNPAGAASSPKFQWRVWKTLNVQTFVEIRPSMGASRSPR